MFHAFLQTPPSPLLFVMYIFFTSHSDIQFPHICVFFSACYVIILIIFNEVHVELRASILYERIVFNTFLDIGFSIRLLSEH